MHLEYFGILLFLFFSVILSLLILCFSYLLSAQPAYAEKASAYECGFDAFDDARLKFDVRFYLVAILFIIFDLEISYLFPWAMVLRQLGAFGFWMMMLFLLVLTIGFVYEWVKGALEWE